MSRLVCGTLFAAKVLLIAALFASASHSAEFSGRVIGIADGDSITVLVGTQQLNVRLVDIDAPEAKQAYGGRSRQSLAQLCHQKLAAVAERRQDRFGRTLAQVTCGGIDANAEQVRRGMAWVFDRYVRSDSPLYLLQNEARATRRGLWQIHTLCHVGSGDAGSVAANELACLSNGQLMILARARAM